MQKKNRRSFSGEPFPGRRMSLERTVNQLTSSGGGGGGRRSLTIGGESKSDAAAGTGLRRASLQTTDRVSGSACRLIITRDDDLPAISESSPVNKPSSSERTSEDLPKFQVTAPAASPEATTTFRSLQPETGSRWRSMAGGSSTSFHGNRAGVGPTREPTIFDIGADYMKVRM